MVFSVLILYLKLNPPPFVKKDESFDSLNVVNHKADWIKKTKGITDVGIEMNAAVAAHADCIIINSSGVSSEFVLNNIPVVATGRSWFSGLNIFHEPKDWEDLKYMIRSGRYHIGPTQKKMRKKWITWWVQHQFLKEDPSTVMKDIVEDFYNRIG